MKNIYTSLLLTAAICLTSNVTLAEGYKSNSAMNRETMNRTYDGTMNDNMMNQGSNSPASSNLNMNQVQEIQSSLREEGYSIGVDGIWGPRTTAALREFQRENNLDVTGQLDNRTMTALNLNFGEHNTQERYESRHEGQNRVYDYNQPGNATGGDYRTMNGGY